MMMDDTYDRCGPWLNFLHPKWWCTCLSRGPLRFWRFYHLVILIQAIGLFLALSIVYAMYNTPSGQLSPPVLSESAPHCPEDAGVSKPVEVSKPVVWIAAKKMETGYLKHVEDVFDRLGYIRNRSHDNWSVLWSHHYPFNTYKEEMKNLKTHQRVNHFPGSGFLTNKVSLMTNVDLPFMPKAFKIPEEKEKFLQYVKENHATQWVQKGTNHRGVSIKAVADLDLTRNDTFIQEYIDKPLLIDGRRFDIGIYTTITSINPLRAYIYEGDWLIRFCPEKYLPFDPSNRDKYVISDDYLPPSKVPVLSSYFARYGYNRKQALWAYFLEHERDASFLTNLRDHIAKVLLELEPKLVAAGQSYSSSRNFFEMVRFDFIVDENHRLYLLEVNMSPNLSSKHFLQNKPLYEQVIFSTLHLVGIARATDYDFNVESDKLHMQVSEADIATFSHECWSHKCTGLCLEEICKLCEFCLKEPQKRDLRQAYLEHMNRFTWRRVFPMTFASPDEALLFNEASDRKFKSLSPANRWMTLWFKWKCIHDEAWCT